MRKRPNSPAEVPAISSLRYSVFLNLLSERELNLDIFGGLVRRRHERPFANGFFRGIRQDFAPGNGFGIGDFAGRVDNGFDDDGSLDPQMLGEVRVNGRDAGLDGAHACGGRVKGESDEEGKRRDPEEAKCGALDEADGGTRWNAEHRFSPGARCACLGHRRRGAAA